jgi:hypothetical protein
VCVRACVCTTCVSNMFRSQKYLVSYAGNTRRKARKSSYKVSIIFLFDFNDNLYGTTNVTDTPENQVKFHENPLGVCPVFPCGQVNRRTDKHGEINVGSCRKRSKNMSSCPHILRQINACTDRRDSAVGIATGCGLDDRVVGVRVPVGSRSFSTSSRPALRPTQLPIQLVLGLFPRG